jgi:hydroxymethylpyrimidine/phosphomethylpyrimidine kinase
VIDGADPTADPVTISKHGAPLIAPDAHAAIAAALLPVATLVTPNAYEAAALVGRELRTLADARDAARQLVDRGARAALVKCGQLDGPPVDVLATRDGEVVALAGEGAGRTRGTARLPYAAAITARATATRVDRGGEGVADPRALHGAPQSQLRT